MNNPHDWSVITLEIDRLHRVRVEQLNEKKYSKAFDTGVLILELEVKIAEWIQKGGK